MTKRHDVRWLAALAALAAATPGVAAPTFLTCTISDPRNPRIDLALDQAAKRVTIRDSRGFIDTAEGASFAAALVDFRIGAPVPQIIYQLDRTTMALHRARLRQASAPIIDRGSCAAGSAFSVPQPIARPPDPVQPALAPGQVRHIVFFSYADIGLAEAGATIDTVVAALRKGKFRSIRITGHGDAAEGAEGNADFYGIGRARAVEAELRRRGIGAGVTIQTSSLGDRQPLVAPRPGQREVQNRRVVILLTP